ncbi:DUF2511 domain-containing protein [Thalassospira alkalitolerans]|uniref:DUF2511 domain-containing protein n=1 Tax=Thalassospira alkalitolerans TaxID=1293890 RepID=UPI003AA987D7
MSTKRFCISFLVCLLSACGAAGTEVSSDQFGKRWPFTVQKGIVDCKPPQSAIFITNGKSYQLNGSAMSAGYPPIDPIWRDNPEIPGTKISLGEMIRLAREHCRK